MFTEKAVTSRGFHFILFYPYYNPVKKDLKKSYVTWNKLKEYVTRGHRTIKAEPRFEPRFSEYKAGIFSMVPVLSS